MNRSTNYNFYLPENSDYRDVSQFNYNFETIDSALFNVGKVTSGGTSNVAVPDATYTTISSVTLAAGVWVIYGGFSWTSSFTQAAYLSFSTSTSGVNIINGTLVQGDGVNGGAKNTCVIVAPSSTTTYYMLGWQGSGSERTASKISMVAARLK